MSPSEWKLWNRSFPIMQRVGHYWFAHVKDLPESSCASFDAIFNMWTVFLLKCCSYCTLSDSYVLYLCGDIALVSSLIVLGWASCCRCESQSLICTETPTITAVEPTHFPLIIASKCRKNHDVFQGFWEGRCVSGAEAKRGRNLEACCLLVPKDQSFSEEHLEIHNRGVLSSGFGSD